MSKKGYKFVRPDDFEQIKKLQDAGITRAQVRQLTGRSQGTVDAIWKVKAFADYKANQLKYRKRAPKTETPVKRVETDETECTKILRNIDHRLEHIEELQENLDNRVKFLENNLVVQPKRRLF